MAAFRVPRALAGLMMLIVLGGPAAAQTPLDEPLDEHAAKRLDRMEKAMKELRAIVFQGRETGQPVVVQPADTESQLSSVSDKIADLQQSLARLNGQLEVVRHDLDQSRQDGQELRARNDALRDQITALEQKVAALTPPPPPVAPPQALAPAAAAAPSLASAKAAFDAGDMAGAESAFQALVDQDGDGPGAPEARYYLARTLLARKAWPQAAEADIGAIRGWPHTRWAPDAIIDLSRALTEMGKTTDACQTLDELAKRYPKPLPAARRAAAEARARAKCDA